MEGCLSLVCVRPILFLYSRCRVYRIKHMHLGSVYTTRQRRRCRGQHFCHGGKWVQNPMNTARHQRRRRHRRQQHAGTVMCKCPHREQYNPFSRQRHSAPSTATAPCRVNDALVIYLLHKITVKLHGSFYATLLFCIKMLELVN